MTKIIPIVLCVFLTGCASIDTKFYDAKDELIGRIEQEQPGAASVEKEGLKMMVDTRKPTAWERFITPILSGAREKAQANVM